MDLDKNTRTKNGLDVARILLRTTMLEPLNHNVRVKIDGHIFNIRIVEEVFGDNILSLPSGFAPQVSLSLMVPIEVQRYRKLQIRWRIKENNHWPILN